MLSEILSLTKLKKKIVYYLCDTELEIAINIKCGNVKITHSIILYICC